MFSINFSINFGKGFRNHIGKDERRIDILIFLIQQFGLFTQRNISIKFRNGFVKSKKKTFCFAQKLLTCDPVYF